MRWILYAVKIYLKAEKIFGCNQPKIFSKNMRGLGNTAGPGETAKKLTKKSVLPEEECTSKVAVPFLYKRMILKHFAFAMNKKLKVFDIFITI